ncbi:MAG TPA: hypothetical protein VFH66_09235 [Mycobacteriales bacterium]|nr:hypothetical protein [Mycobacteriales bacterium]
MRPTLTCVEGVGMHRHSARLMRFAGGALAAAAVTPFLGGVALAGSAKPAPPSGDDRAGVTSYSGNVTTCAQIGMSDATQIGGGTGDYVADGWNIASDGKDLTVKAVADGQQIDALVVKGGDGYNIYDASFFASNELPVGDIHAPLVGNPPTNVPTISHWFACTGPAEVNPPPVTVDPSASISPSCDQAVVTLDAGSGDAEFVISPAGNETDQDISVSAGGEQLVNVTWDSTKSTVTVYDKNSENQLATATRDNEGCAPQQPVTDPAVSFANSCKSGISVTLTNMKVDNTTTDPVTFTIVTPSGATKHVTVRADQIVRLSYKVKEDTTGTVTVSAPGLTATTHSYAKNCTSVLGEKVVRTPKTPKPAVQGEKAQLPFTGMPTALAALLGAVMLAVGGALNVLGRKRQDGVSAS